MKDRIRIDVNSNDWRSARLSNLSHSPFVLDGQAFASVEGFIQHMNFDYGDFRRELCVELDGPDAAAMSYQVEQIWDSKPYTIGCHYDGAFVDFHSPSWDEIVTRAIRAKFEQHETSRKALTRTIGLELEYDIDRTRLNTSIDPRLFLDILNRIRDRMEVNHGNEEGAV